ncbi:hypothetical protein DFJ74DRAFT_347431 [Hyaloraphidium curvatum]|nr:hypothetical protein DFJ74DRAFT_347431 [Hyaloraphidium curvatum]
MGADGQKSGSQAPRKRAKAGKLNLFDVIESQLSTVTAGASEPAVGGGKPPKVASAASAPRRAGERPPVNSGTPHGGPPSVVGSLAASKSSTGLVQRISTLQVAAGDVDKPAVDKHRGFQRETPRPKKLTATKRAVLLQRGLAGVSPADRTGSGSTTGVVVDAEKGVPSDTLTSDSESSEASDNASNEPEETSESSQSNSEGVELHRDLDGVEFRSASEAEGLRIPGTGGAYDAPSASSTGAASLRPVWDGVNARLGWEGERSRPSDGGGASSDQDVPLEASEATGDPAQPKTRRRRKKKASAETSSGTRPSLLHPKPELFTRFLGPGSAGQARAVPNSESEFESSEGKVEEENRARSARGTAPLHAG